MELLKRLNEEEILFYDIETARVEKELQLDTPLFDSWAYKKAKEADLSNEELQASYKEEAGLYPEFSKVVCIVVSKIKDGVVNEIVIKSHDEVEVLSKFASVLKRNPKDILCGFANHGFDDSFVRKRMVINGISLPNHLDTAHLKPWEKGDISVDLASLWKGDSWSRASLINIVVALGLPSPKDDISGKDVGNVYWEDENGLDRIATYCSKDVLSVINVFKKMRYEEPISIGDSFEESPVVQKIFNGGPYGQMEKKVLTDLLTRMDTGERGLAFEVLKGIISRAKGKETQMTTQDLKDLKEHFNE